MRWKDKDFVMAKAGESQQIHSEIDTVSSNSTYVIFAASVLKHKVHYDGLPGLSNLGGIFFTS